jgi:uncharacterized membrane protein YgcG
MTRARIFALAGRRAGLVGRRAALTIVLGGAVALALPVAALGRLTLPPSQAGRYVYDLAGIWSASAIDQAQSTAVAIRDRTGAEVAIVSWPSDDSDVSTGTARADAITIMDTWGVGRAGVDDGLVVLFDMDSQSQLHGQIYLYAGSGFLDRYLNEDEASGVVNDAMLPRAVEGDLDAALLDGLQRIDHVVQPGGNPDRGTQALVNALLAALVIGVGLLVFGLFLRTWWERGRDARVVLVDDSVLLPVPPPGLTPALATVLRKDAVDKDGFTSALVDLGHRGLVTFEQASGDRKHVDLVVPPSPLIDPNSLEARRRPLGSAESGLADAIATKATGGVLSWSELKGGEGAKLWESFKKDAGRAAKAAGYFRDDPNRLSGRWLAVGIALIAAVVAFGFVFAFDTSENSNLFRAGRDFFGLPILISAMLGGVIALFSGRLAARTPDGARTLAMSLAYRNTLKFEMAASHSVDEAVEKTRSRLPWITTPDLLTVWAVAFGLKDEIDDLIKETFAQAQATGVGAWSPLWFSGSDGMGSTSSVSSMIGSIGTTAASSSGSGYGGGGSGGGGGAGGGF